MKRFESWFIYLFIFRKKTFLFSTLLSNTVLHPYQSVQCVVLCVVCVCVCVCVFSVCVCLVCVCVFSV